MSLILVDSSVYIRAARADIDLFARFDAISGSHEIAINGMVWMEVIRGRAEPTVRRRYEERFATMLFLNTTARTWQRATALAWEMDRRGDVIKAQDLIIATCALEHDAAVLSFDRHFLSVPGLSVLRDLP